MSIVKTYPDNELDLNVRINCIIKGGTGMFIKFNSCFFPDGTLFENILAGNKNTIYANIIDFPEQFSKEIVIKLLLHYLYLAGMIMEKEYKPNVEDYADMYDLVKYINDANIATSIVKFCKDNDIELK